MMQRHWRAFMGHLPPASNEPEEIVTLRFQEIEVKSFVGGLVKGIEHKAG